MNGVLLNNASYQLVSIPKEASWDTATPTVIDTFTKGEVLLESLFPDTLQYGMKVCDTCKGSGRQTRVMNTIFGQIQQDENCQETFFVHSCMNYAIL